MQKVMLVVAAMVAACGGGGGDDGHATGDAKQADALVDTRSADAFSCTSSKVIFLNRAGGTYTVGPDDATTNTAAFLDMQRTFAAYPHADPSWANVKDCVTQAFAPFGVTVTDVDPGTAPHHEILLTGTAHWSDTSSTVTTSISSGPCPAGSPGTHPALPTNGIAFVFTAGFGGAERDHLICETAVGQVATEISGLDHALDCHDFLDLYHSDCGPRSFLDTPIMCGEFSARVCNCGGTTQNSHQTMANVLCN